MKQSGDELLYEYDGQLKKVIQKEHSVNYLKDGDKKSIKITAYYTHHGPVLGKRNDKWLSLKEQNRSLNGLIQSWERTKAKNFDEYKKTLGSVSNNSTNTLYADRGGNIAYWHGNFIPKRNPAYDWSQPVDGSTLATEWKGAHSINEIVHFKNPTTGFYKIVIQRLLVQQVLILFQKTVRCIYGSRW
jgi:acyl-homoserine lactone acylase PvdQ